VLRVQRACGLNILVEPHTIENALRESKNQKSNQSCGRNGALRGDGRSISGKGKDDEKSLSAN